MDLSLADNATVLTGDMVKKILQDLFARYKKAFAGWKASGNGKMGQGKEGDSIRLLINGILITQIPESPISITMISQSSIVMMTVINSVITVSLQHICGGMLN